ncbi:MAG: hypothetical protein JOZ80_07420 [Acidobacteriaceae bacterium]|nr:hypothetical protein [Acidobacteriaceae bacterium]
MSKQKTVLDAHRSQYPPVELGFQRKASENLKSGAELSFRMKSPIYGRIVFGASAVLFGVIALMWHDAETWQTLRQIWKLPFGGAVGECLMAAQIAGGVGILYPRSTRLGSAVLCIVYVCFSLACIPDIIAASNPYERYGGSFFQQLSLVCGAIALYAATEGSAARTAILGRGATLGLGICAISFTLGQALFLRDTAGLVPRWIPPNQMFWAVVTTIAFALAAIAILVNRQARMATRLMTVMLVLFGVLVWIPRLIARPKAHFYWSEFALTALIAGAAWTVADLSSFSSRGSRARLELRADAS